jgi:hypothetical protein
MSESEVMWVSCLFRALAHLIAHTQRLDSERILQYEVREMEMEKETPQVKGTCKGGGPTERRSTRREMAARIKAGTSNSRSHSHRPQSTPSESKAHIYRQSLCMAVSLWSTHIRTATHQDTRHTACCAVNRLVRVGGSSGTGAWC